MVFVVRLVLGDGGQVPVLICAAEAAVVKAVNYHWRIRGESGAVGLHLREDDGDRGGGEDPAPLLDGVGQYPEGGRRIGELVRIASPYEEGRDVVLLAGRLGGDGQLPRQVREGVHPWTVCILYKALLGGDRPAVSHLQLRLG